MTKMKVVRRDPEAVENEDGLWKVGDGVQYYGYCDFASTFIAATLAADLAWNATIRELIKQIPYAEAGWIGDVADAALIKEFLQERLRPTTPEVDTT